MKTTLKALGFVLILGSLSAVNAFATVAPAMSHETATRNVATTRNAAPAEPALAPHESPTNRVNTHLGATPVNKDVAIARHPESATMGW